MQSPRPSAPADAEAMHKARIAAHAARVAQEMTGGVPHKPGMRGRSQKPVISDRGEWFKSTTFAAKRFGKSRAGIRYSIVKGGLCAKRHWRYATSTETAAALEKKRRRTEAARAFAIPTNPHLNCCNYVTCR